MLDVAARELASAQYRAAWHLHEWSRHLAQARALGDGVDRRSRPSVRAVTGVEFRSWLVLPLTVIRRLV